jgi:alpha-tubulin suppressor-like RCC1 family protein
MKFTDKPTKEHRHVEVLSSRFSSRNFFALIFLPPTTSMMMMQCSSSAACCSRTVRASSRLATAIHNRLQPYNGCRGMAVYAMGEGWTGALGIGGTSSSLTRTVPGHDDEYEEVLDGIGELDPPICVYEGPVVSAAAGWGHSCLITEHDYKLLVCGRPHDFSALLRLKRLPTFLRNYAVQHALRYNESGNQQYMDTLSGQVVSFLLGKEQDGPEGPWRDAKRNSILPEYTHVNMPLMDEIPSSVVASAGLTAILTSTGSLYTFGLNHHGQCGIGSKSNNVWTPQAVMGLSTLFADEGRAQLQQEYPIQKVALGLQHGLALDTEGHVFVWGKGERGQLGIQEQTTIESAQRVVKFRLPSKDGKQQWVTDLCVTNIAAGLNHAAVVTSDNLVFVWGRNVAVPQAKDDLGKPAVDALAPILVKGLPSDLKVLDIACGSHHTSILLQDGSVWAVGIATDTSRLEASAIELVPPGVIEMPCSFFGAHFDRTTVIGNDGRQVLQVHLWSDEELRQEAVFTPAWMDYFDDDTRIQSVHRGWLHTLVVTKD